MVRVSITFPLRGFLQPASHLYGLRTHVFSLIPACALSVFPVRRNSAKPQKICPSVPCRVSYLSLPAGFLTFRSLCLVLLGVPHVRSYPESHVFCVYKQRSLPFSAVQRRGVSGSSFSNSLRLSAAVCVGVITVVSRSRVVSESRVLLQLYLRVITE